MTTTQIASYADPEALSSPDINLQVELRRNVIPAFYEDIGEVGWRRRYWSDTVTTGNRDFIVPQDFGELKKVIPGTASNMTFDESYALPYIGDNADLVLAAEAATAQGKPTGYYIDWLLSPYPAIKLSCPVDEDTTFRLVYLAVPFFVNDTTAVNLDIYIPKKLQWGLVEGLRRVIYERRYGVGDNRWVVADGSYQQWVRKARKNPEQTGQSRPRFVN